MRQSLPRGEEPNVFHSVPARWRPPSYVWALALGMALIGSLTTYVIHRDYRTTLTLWNSKLSGAVIGRTWLLRNSLQESRDDTQVLADFVPARELLLLGREAGGVSVPRAALLKRVVGLFDEYRRVYEYAAVCLLDSKGKVVVGATDPGAWTAVIQSAQFKDFTRTRASIRGYSVGTLPASSEERALIFMIPVFTDAAVNKSGSGTTSPLGAVVILDPLARELTPLLKAESNFSYTGEALLLWVQGGEGGYASPRRYLVGRIGPPCLCVRYA